MQDRFFLIGVSVPILDQRITDIADFLLQCRKYRMAMFLIEQPSHITGGSECHNQAALLLRNPPGFANHHETKSLAAIAFIHPKLSASGIHYLRNTSADDLAVFILSFENEFI